MIILSFLIVLELCSSKEYFFDLLKNPVHKVEVLEELQIFHIQDLLLLISFMVSFRF